MLIDDNIILDYEVFAQELREWLTKIQSPNVSTITTDADTTTHLDTTAWLWYVSAWTQEMQTLLSAEMETNFKEVNEKWDQYEHFVECLSQFSNNLVERIKEVEDLLSRAGVDENLNEMLEHEMVHIEKTMHSSLDEVLKPITRDLLDEIEKQISPLRDLMISENFEIKLRRMKESFNQEFNRNLPQKIEEEINESLSFLSGQIRDQLQQTDPSYALITDMRVFLKDENRRLHDRKEQIDDLQKRFQPPNIVKDILDLFCKDQESLDAFGDLTPCFPKRERKVLENLFGANGSGNLNRLGFKRAVDPEEAQKHTLELYEKYSDDVRGAPLAWVPIFSHAIDVLNALLDTLVEE